MRGSYKLVFILCVFAMFGALNFQSQTFRHTGLLINGALFYSTGALKVLRILYYTYYLIQHILN